MYTLIRNCGLMDLSGGETGFKNVDIRPDIVTQAYNPVYSGGGDWEDQSSKPAWAKSL
jgi:hypothetical protein